MWWPDRQFNWNASSGTASSSQLMYFGECLVDNSLYLGAPPYSYFFAHLALSKNPQGLPLTFNTRSATSSETACNSRNLFSKSLAWIIRCKYFWLGFGINFGRTELFIVVHFQCWIDYNRRVFCNSIEEEQTGCALLQISMIFGGIRVSAKFFPAARTKLFSQLWHLCIFALMSPSYSQWSNSLLVLQIVQRIK